MGEVIEVLDAAYPRHLAHSWDSVGLVCGDPDETVTSVTVTVDVTAAVVADSPAGGFLLAHHRLLRAGSALFTAHTNADAAAPGVSDALADALGLTVTGVLDPEPAAELDKWVTFVPVEHTDAVRAALFDAGAGRIGDYSQCSWSVTGAGQFLPGAAATPVIGAPGALERVVEDRVEVIAPARLRTRVLAALRAAHPYEEPAFDVLALAPLPSDTGIGRVAALPEPEPLSAFVARVRRRLPATSWGVRASGDPDALISRVALCGGAGDSLLDAVDNAGVQAYVTADLRHHPADEYRRGSPVALVDVAHWASEQPWCHQAAALLTSHFGGRLPVRVSEIRTDPWNVESDESR